MGSICIIIGILFFLLFLGGGYFLTAKLATTQIMGQSLLAFIGLKSTGMAYIIICGACAVIGLILCFTFLMIGTNRKKIAANEDEISALRSRIRKLEKGAKSAEKKKSSSKKASVSEDLFEADEN